MDKSGYLVWEGIVLLIEIIFVLTVVVLRRKASGRPAFTIHDRHLLFGHSRIRLLTPRFCLKFCMVAVLCSFVGLLERVILAPFGATILATAQLLTYMGIVKKWLC